MENNKTSPSVGPFEVSQDDGMFEIGFRVPTGGLRMIACMYDGGPHVKDVLPMENNAILLAASWEMSESIKKANWVLRNLAVNNPAISNELHVLADSLWRSLPSYKQEGV